MSCHVESCNAMFVFLFLLRMDGANRAHSGSFVADEQILGRAHSETRDLGEQSTQRKDRSVATRS